MFIFRISQDRFKAAIEYIDILIDMLGIIYE